jgi:hypothetical protein
MKLLRYILSVAFALYFLLAGTGLNIIRYCCDSCAKTGIAAMVITQTENKQENQQDCCDMEAPTGHDDPSQQLNQINQDENCCSFRHLTVDTPTNGAYTFHFDIKQFQNFNLFCFVIPALTLQLQQNDLFKDKNPPPQKLIISGREILSLHAVLLI